MSAIDPIVNPSASGAPCCGPGGCATPLELNEFGDPTGRNADFNNDGFVDFFDFDDFVVAFETGC